MPKRLDLMGQKFGRLLVIEDAGNNERGDSQWLCRCDCRNTIIVRGSNLKGDYVRSCGCLNRERVSETHRSNLTGQKFGYLTVVEDVGNNKWGQSQWLCKCDCGNEIVILGCSLKSDNTKSCGCLQKERASEVNKLNLKLGDKYGRWMVIKNARSNRWGDSLWLCRCDCGTERTVLGYSLKSSGSKSCGCYNRESARERFTKHGQWGTKAYDIGRNAKRRAKKKNQIAVNYNQEKVDCVYRICEIINQLENEKYEVDHWQPLSKEGEHGQDNMQILLKSLNAQKKDKWPLTEEEKIRYKGITLADIEKESWIDILAEGNYKESNYGEQKNSV